MGTNRVFVKTLIETKSSKRTLGRPGRRFEEIEWRGVERTVHCWFRDQCGAYINNAVSLRAA
jgi:hypothetical protein